MSYSIFAESKTVQPSSLPIVQKKFETKSFPIGRLDRPNPVLDFLSGAHPVEVIYVHAPASVEDSYAIGLEDGKAVTGTLERLKAEIRGRLGASVRGFTVEYMKSIGDSVDFIALVAIVIGVGRNGRHEMHRELNRIISSSESSVVRERIIVKFR